VKVARDTWLAFQRAFGQTIRTPIVIGVMLGQPVFFLFLFGPLLKNSLRGIAPDEVLNVFIPGLMVQLVLFGALSVGYSLTAELNRGVIERFQVTPVSRFSLLLGRALRDAVVVVVPCVLIVVLAIPLGLRVPPAGLIAMLGIMVLLTLALAAVSYGLALVLKRDEVLAPLVTIVAGPLLLLSGILIPMSYAPGWLRAASWVNPLTEVVNGGRQLFAGHLWNGTVALAVILPAALAAVALALVGRLFLRAAR
jgi:ABC-2 type transport system permease protein